MNALNKTVLFARRTNSIECQRRAKRLIRSAKPHSACMSTNSLSNHDLGVPFPHYTSWHEPIHQPEACVTDDLDALNYGYRVISPTPYYQLDASHTVHSNVSFEGSPATPSASQQGTIHSLSMAYAPVTAGTSTESRHERLYPMSSLQEAVYAAHREWDEYNTSEDAKDAEYYSADCERMKPN
jgi:hypothetical protein